MHKEEFSMKSNVWVIAKSALFSLLLYGLIWGIGVLFAGGNIAELKTMVRTTVFFAAAMIYFLWIRKQEQPWLSFLSALFFVFVGAGVFWLVTKGIPAIKWEEFFQERYLLSQYSLTAETEKLVISKLFSASLLCLELVLCLGVGELLLLAKKGIEKNEKAKKAMPYLLHGGFLLFMLISAVLLALFVPITGGGSGSVDAGGMEGALARWNSFVFVLILAIVFVFEATLWRMLWGVFFRNSGENSNDLVLDVAACSQLVMFVLSFVNVLLFSQVILAKASLDHVIFELLIMIIEIVIIRFLLHIRMLFLKDREGSTH
jgi:hypothetical protein